VVHRLPKVRLNQTWVWSVSPEPRKHEHAVAGDRRDEVRLGLGRERLVEIDLGDLGSEAGRDFPDLHHAPFRAPRCEKLLQLCGCVKRAGKRHNPRRERTWRWAVWRVCLIECG
jgi:hypothetical protein